MKAKYQICTNCIMDTSDPNITFDKEGVCSHCRNFEINAIPNWFRGEEGKAKIDEMLVTLKNHGKNKRYDCIIGLSGGVDSSYLAYLCSQWGLRPLVVHVDAGWNSDMAVKNIENICKKLNFDLITEVIDWSQMKELQKAFFKSRVTNQDIPQDHAFFAALYRYATKNKIKYVLTGYNISSEGILPLAFRGYPALDSKHLKSIFYKNGGKRLNNFPLVDTLKLRLYYPYIYGMKMIAPLNYMEYDKLKALALLKKELDFNDYGSKHSESRFTKFHQNYFLPKMFGYEKRRAHLSSLIVAGHISRQNALNEMSIPFYHSNVEENEDIEYVSKKLGLSATEFDQTMALGPGRHEDYPSEAGLTHKLNNIAEFLKRIYFKVKPGSTLKKDSNKPA